MPIVSVIIPVFNGSKYVEETIQSVLNQTFQDFEILIINDGSVDSTLDIVLCFNDPRILIYCYPNRGLSASRNRGIQRAKGDFISFIDADDLWAPDKLELQLKALNTNPKAAVVYSWSSYIDEKGSNFKDGLRTNHCGNVYQDSLLQNFTESGSNILVKTSVFAEAGSFDETLRHAADWDMAIRLASHFDFAVVNKRQILYRKLSNSLSSKSITLEHDCFQVVNKSFAEAPAHLKHLKHHALHGLYIYLIFRALQNLSRTDCAASIRLLFAYTKRFPRENHTYVILKALLKIMAILILPNRFVKYIFITSRVNRTVSG